nr:unnamed protein product [Callosobruchus analis]
MDPQLMLNAAPGAWGVCSDSGWMTAELFLGWFKKFIKFSGATFDRPVLLLLDGHRTRTQNIDVIIETRSNGVIILCLPPHTNNKLQVAEIAYMRPLSVYYDQQITAWFRSNPGMVISVRQVAEIFGKAFVQACKMATAVVSPEQVMPYPATHKMIRVTRKRGKTAIITSSPYKNESEETINRKKLEEDNKKRKTEAKDQKKHTKTNSSKKKIKKSTNNNLISPPESDNEENNITCFYCLGKYLDSDEGWVACSLCEKWAHCSCAGIDDEDDEATFTFEFCN